MTHPRPALTTHGKSALPFRPTDVLDRAPIRKLLEVAAEAGSTHFDFGPLDLGDAQTRDFLETLADIRARELYGIESQCILSSRCSGKDVDLLFKAGVRRIQFELQNFRGGCSPNPEPMRLNGLQLESVVRCCSLQMDVLWTLFVPADPEGEAEALRLCQAAPHLQPPSSVFHSGGKMPEERVNEAVALWRENYSPRTLTCARGPGFVRVLDSRLDAKNWTFFVMNETQAEIFIRCGSVQNVADLLSHPVLTAEAIGRFIESLAGRGLMFLSREGWAVALVPRKRLDEPWASGDH